MEKMILKTQDLKDYMRIILELEKNIRIQNETIDNLNNEICTLGIPQAIEIPQKEKVHFSDTFFECGITVGFICGLITVVIIFFSNIGNNFGQWIWNFIPSAFKSLVLGAAVALGTGIIFGLIIAIFVFAHRKNKANEEYKYNMNLYYSALQSDEKRVKIELEKKTFIENKIDLLKQKHNDTSQLLKKMYNYGILHRDYHNIIAVATIYGYLDKGRCRTLEFDASTGDKGAYNIYENEKRLDTIITNEQIIIQHLEEIKKNQQQLYNVMEDIFRTVNKMSKSVSKSVQMFTKMQVQLDRLNDNTEVDIYNQQQAAAELRYMNFMNDMTRKY